MAVDEKKGGDFKKDKNKGDKYKTVTEAQSIYKCGIPPYVTVDELHYYRRRRPGNWLQERDNLKVEEGSFKYLKTEYKRRFKNFFDALRSISNGKEKSNIFFVQPAKQQESSLKLDGVHAFQSEYKESFNPTAFERLSKPSQKTVDERLMDKGTVSGISELEPPQESTSATKVRPLLTKRPTTLKIEGDFSHTTEHSDNFIEYLIAKRAELLRTPTTLKLEGEMEIKTETRDQFVKYENTGRPPLCKKFTQLHLEGNLDTLTEKREKFVPFEMQKRPPLVKKLTNLHLEGDLSLMPEYRRAFVPYEASERPKPALPVNHLKAGGSFENVPTEDKLFSTKYHPLIPNLREFDKDHDSHSSKPPTRRSSYGRGEPADKSFSTRASPSISRMPSQPNITLTKATNSDLSRSSINIDCFGSYEQLPTRRRKRDSELSYLKGDGKMEMQPEYKSSYVYIPSPRPEPWRPECHLSSKGEVQYVTEKLEKYQPHRVIEKTEPCIREPELKVEGYFECEPEYRKAYRDYLIRERKPPLVPRKRVVEVPEGFEKTEINGDISDSSVNHSSASLEKSKLTPEVTEVVKESSSSISSVPASPKPTPRPSRLPLPKSNINLSPRQRGSSPSLSPQPPSRRGSVERGRSPSPNVSATLRKRSSRSVPRSNDIVGLDEDDPAFVVLREKPMSRRCIRHNLYKEQKWMPSWSYSLD